MLGAKALDQSLGVWVFDLAGVGVSNGAWVGLQIRPGAAQLLLLQDYALMHLLQVLASASSPWRPHPWPMASKIFQSQTNLPDEAEKVKNL